MPASLTYIGRATSNTNATSYNFGNFTAASDGLLVAVVQGGSSAARTITGVTIGGSAGDARAASGSALETSAIYTRAVSAGSHNVTATFSSTMQNAAVDVYLLTGHASDVPSDTDGVNGTGTSAALTLDFPADGAAVYGVQHINANATSWSAAAEDADATLETTRQYAAARKTATGAGNTETASWSGSVGYAGVAAVWAGAGGGSIVPQVMHHRRMMGRG